jgi:hypothetical protein
MMNRHQPLQTCDSPGYGHEYGRALLAGYHRILQCDGYSAYKKQR